MHPSLGHTQHSESSTQAMICLLLVEILSCRAVGDIKQKPSCSSHTGHDRQRGQRGSSILSYLVDLQDFDVYLLEEVLKRQERGELPVGERKILPRCFASAWRVMGERKQSYRAQIVKVETIKKIGLVLFCGCQLFEWIKKRPGWLLAFPSS